jgi:hypothetical protein
MSWTNLVKLKNQQKIKLEVNAQNTRKHCCTPM